MLSRMAPLALFAAAVGLLLLAGGNDLAVWLAGGALLAGLVVAARAAL